MKRSTILFYILLLVLVPVSYFLLTDPADTGPRVNEEVPETILPDTAGAMISLSELRGNMVLVNFWASWCRPCREKNPDITKLYNEFSSKSFKNGGGFEIYSISLDRNKDAWINAIHADELQWKWHASELKRFDTESVTDFGVQSIPVSFLINQEGKVLVRTSNIDEVRKILKDHLATDEV
jgi:thiol-disulfide isomerase/thioredoxin